MRGLNQVKICLNCKGNQFIITESHRGELNFYCTRCGGWLEGRNS